MSFRSMNSPTTKIGQHVARSYQERRRKPSACPSMLTWAVFKTEHVVPVYYLVNRGSHNGLFFPTLTCGIFVFSSVSAFLLRRLPPPASRLTHTHSLTHSLTQLNSIQLNSTHSMCILRGRRGTMCTAKGLDVRPGVPCVSAAFAWQAWDNVSW